jgi:hypothetical protein
MASSDQARKKPLDVVVKMGLGVFVGSFALIWGGMYLTRPDRSIPPYTVGAQLGSLVAVHVPRNTPDEQVEKLLRRFRWVGHTTRDFGPLKIYPTTPGNPGGRYRSMVVLVFSDDGWTESTVLERYERGDEETVKAVQRAMRGYYRLEGEEEEGAMGPLSRNGGAFKGARILFKGLVTDPLPVEAESVERGISLSPL